MYLFKIRLPKIADRAIPTEFRRSFILCLDSEREAIKSFAGLTIQFSNHFLIDLKRLALMVF
jgi:hypothetical protein